MYPRAVRVITPEGTPTPAPIAAVFFGVAWPAEPEEPVTAEAAGAWGVEWVVVMVMLGTLVFSAKAPAGMYRCPNPAPVGPLI